MKNLNLTTFKNNSRAVQAADQLAISIDALAKAVKLQREMEKGSITIKNILSDSKNLGGNIKGGIPQFGLEAGANSNQRFFQNSSITITKK